MSFWINIPDPKCITSDKLKTKINVGSMTKESRTFLNFLALDIGIYLTIMHI